VNPGEGSVDDVVMMISEAPADPVEKDAWAHQMMRVQVAMWIDGKSRCEICGHVFESVDDFLDREVCALRMGPDGKWDHSFACETCFVESQLG